MTQLPNLGEAVCSQEISDLQQHRGSKPTHPPLTRPHPFTPAWIFLRAFRLVPSFPVWTHHPQSSAVLHPDRPLTTNLPLTRSHPLSPARIFPAFRQISSLSAPRRLWGFVFIDVASAVRRRVWSAVA